MREIDVDHANAGQRGQSLTRTVKAVNAVAVVEELADLHDEQVVFEWFVGDGRHGRVPVRSGQRRDWGHATTALAQPVAHNEHTPATPDVVSKPLPARITWTHVEVLVPATGC